MLRPTRNITRTVYNLNRLKHPMPIRTSVPNVSALGKMQFLLAIAIASGGNGFTANITTHRIARKKIHPPINRIICLFRFSFQVDTSSSSPNADNTAREKLNKIMTRDAALVEIAGNFNAYSKSLSGVGYARNIEKHPSTAKNFTYPLSFLLIANTDNRSGIV
jgi:hypothetical protein